MTVRILTGDCREVLKTLPEASVDSIVTDPPYGLSFMGKRWDYDVPSVELWAECLRVLKPGGYLLAFAGTRTQHRMATNIEDAGFEIRDMIAWVYGSGFPKSLNVANAIQSGGGRPEDIRRMQMGEDYQPSGRGRVNYDHGAGSAMNGAPVAVDLGDDARRWQGWGTALKPALEPITVARKPLIGTVAANVLEHGTGALNIDACRVPTTDSLGGGGEKAETSAKFTNDGWRRPWMNNPEALESMAAKVRANVARAEALGRWPANLIHDGSDEVVALFPAEAGAQAPVHRRNADKFRTTYGAFKGDIDEAGSTFQGDSGSAARFFYCAKATKADRGEGNTHPTVKPTALMRYLCRLVTPPGGTVLDPFAGSGSTLIAAEREGFDSIGIELSEKYVAIARRRLIDDAPLFSEVEA